MGSDKIMSQAGKNYDLYAIISRSADHCTELILTSHYDQKRLITGK